MLHRDSVMRNHHELRVAAHLQDATGQSILIGFVERCVDFVKQTEGSRVEFEDGKDERRGRHCLLSARKQFDAGVFLARRLSRHLDARFQNLFAAHPQFGTAAAEKPRKHLPKVLVDLRKCGAQQLSGFGIDLANRCFQVGDGFFQVRHLSFGFFHRAAAFLKVLKRGMVDRSQRGNGFV